MVLLSSGGRAWSVAMSAFSSALVALLSRYCWMRSASLTSVATELGLLCLLGSCAQGWLQVGYYTSKRTECRVQTMCMKPAGRR